MKQVHQIKIFISCPGGNTNEIDSIRLIVDEINKTSGKDNGYTLECLSWSMDTYTQVRTDAQEVINEQIDPEYDILVGILWHRAGTPTKRDKSGTIEEINRAISNKIKELLIYFNTATPDSLDSIDGTQLNIIKEFKRDLSQRGVLYKEYSGIRHFESQFRVHLTSLIRDRLLPQSNSSLKITTNKNKYSEVSGLLQKVENNADPDIDIFELTEELTSVLGIVTTSLDTITINLEVLTGRLNNRSKELNTLAAIKDNRLRLSKAKVVISLLAGELDDFSSKINIELPRFSEHFTSIAHLYAKVFLYLSKSEEFDVADLRNSVLHFRDSMQGAMENGAKFLEEITKWPPANSVFNKSKRTIELAVKDLVKEMLEGLKLLDEVIEIDAD